MYLGFADHDRARPATDKLAEAIDRYRAKFHREPTEAIVAPVEADRLGGDGPVAVKARSYIPAGVFYVGRDDEPAG